MILTGLNALKEPCVDDPAYLAVARQISLRPLDPYGFHQFWYSHVQPANEVLAPPVLPYWLGLGIRLFGERPLLLKLWLFPIALLLAYSLGALLRRFARGVEPPFLVALILSPMILPAFNFMLDVPALALELTALAIMLRALDRKQLGLAILSGVVAGLATQTKYNAGIIVIVITLTALIHRRIVFAIAAALAASAVFWGWEAVTHSLYGESHFIHALRSSDDSILDRDWLGMAALNLAGGLGLPIVLLIAAAILRRPVVVAACAGLLIAVYATIALVPDSQPSLWVPDELRVGNGYTKDLFESAGWIYFAALAALVLRLLARLNWRRPTLRFRILALLLIAWVALEWSGYVVMTQFPAARRILGALVTTTLMTAHLAARTCHWRRVRIALWFAALPVAAVGLLFGIVDVRDSRLEPEALRQAVAAIRERDPKARIWFTGHWGFQYEAERLGLKRMIPDDSVLQPGDWVIDSPRWIARQEFEDDGRLNVPAITVRIDRSWNLRTLPPYHGGHRPIESWPNPAIEVKVHRMDKLWQPKRLSLNK